MTVPDGTQDGAFEGEPDAGAPETGPAPSRVRRSSGSVVKRRQRMSSDEAAERLMSSALDDIATHGLTVTLDHLSFEDFILDAGVARSAAYRRWANKELFFADLFLELSKSREHLGGYTAIAETVPMVAEVALSRLDDLATAEGRRAVFVELCRLGAEHNFRQLFQQPAWQTYLAVAATLGSIDNTDLQTQAKARLTEIEEEFLVVMSALYETMGQVLGYQLKPGVTYETMAVLGGAIVDGLALQGALLSKQIPDAVVVADPFNVHVEQEWTVPAIGYTALFLGLLEFLPEAQMTAKQAEDFLRATLQQFAQPDG